MRILLVEDCEDDAVLLEAKLRSEIQNLQMHRVACREDLLKNLSAKWDIVICDYSLPQLNALAVIQILKDQDTDLPCIIVSGSIGEERAVELMKAGADDYLIKGNLARLGQAVLHKVEESRQKQQLNSAEKKLREAGALIDRLKRFFPPQIADQFVSGEIDDPFAWHNQEVSVVFIDLRGFTAFSEKASPQRVLATLNDYYRTVAGIAHSYNGSIGHLAADGIMIFFNDPVRVDPHQRLAVQMALEARDALLELSFRWGADEITMNFGIGIAAGEAAIGGIGSEGCWDFTVVGTVTNLASRLCSTAKQGQILVSKTFLSHLNQGFSTAEIGEVELKGLDVPVRVFNILGQA